MSKQDKVVKKPLPRPRREQQIDTRTPSGKRKLPY